MHAYSKNSWRRGTIFFYGHELAFCYLNNCPLFLSLMNTRTYIRIPSCILSRFSYSEIEIFGLSGRVRTEQFPSFSTHDHIYTFHVHLLLPNCRRDIFLQLLIDVACMRLLLKYKMESCVPLAKGFLEFEIRNGNKYFDDKLSEPREM